MKRNIIVSALIVVAVLLVLFSLKPKPNLQNDTITPNKDLSICPFTLAKDDVFKVVLDKCENAKKTVVPEGTFYSGDAKVLEVQKLDGTIVKTFPGESFDTGYVTTSNSTITHDDSNSYIFLGTGSWVVWDLEIFSLNDGRTTSLSYMNGVITKNGYFVYTSADGLKNAHEQVDQSNATDVVALKLSDFSKKTLFTGTKDTDYSVKREKIVVDEFLPRSENDFILINKGVWLSNGKLGKPEQIKVPITELSLQDTIVNDSQKSGIIGKVVDISGGGAQAVDALGNPIGPNSKEIPFSFFEFKVINDVTLAEKNVTTDKDGNFQINLFPGSYTIKKGAKYGPALMGNDYKVTVKQNEFTKIDMSFGYNYP